jgi:2,3-bisphosphoglycerate-dependent phosphoglycerate mutase
MPNAASMSEADAAGTLVLVRHAQSAWNMANCFTGWTDVPLAPEGLKAAQCLGERLATTGLRFDRVFISRQQRARQTLDAIFEVMAHPTVPVHSDWRLNERHYGALQGMNKDAIALTYGAAQMQRWRRGYADRPPALATDDPRHPAHDPRYADLTPAEHPATESLADVFARVLPAWRARIAPRLACSERVLIVAHGNSLRALIKYLEGITDEAVEALEVPYAEPLGYRCVGAPLRCVPAMLDAMPDEGAATSPAYSDRRSAAGSRSR